MTRIRAPRRGTLVMLRTCGSSRPTAVICQSGYRSTAGASILQRHGFREIYNIVGGTAAWIGAEYPVEKKQ